MSIVKLILVQILAFSSGLVIAGGVFAFIATVGLVPRFAKKTKTQGQIHLYEACIVIGGIWGSSTLAVDYYLPIGVPGAIAFALGVGIFVGCMAVSLAEIMDVIPILTRRGHVTNGLPYFILCIALGKLAGSMLYYLVPGFYFL